MTILYLLGIRIFQIMVIIISPFNKKAKLWLDGRKNIFGRLSDHINKDEKVAWFHCASLGEFEQGRPVIEAFRKKYLNYKILLTFYSPSGYEIRRNYEFADYIYYLPLDTPYNAKRFVEIVNPKMVFFIKYEFWYFFLKEIHKKNIPLYLVSGIFRKNQRFFKKGSIKSRKMLMWFTHFFVQNEESKRLLQSIKIEASTITGDTRFDRVYAITQKAKNLPLVEKFSENSKVLVGGSTWKPDEDLLIKYYNENNKDLKLIIAPHEIHKENIERIINSIKTKKVVRYSETTLDNINKAEILIIDGIGFLSSVYRYGTIAYIGGGFGKGIHNILEAATFGLPILFGPNHLKFKEAVDLKKQGGAISVSNYSELEVSLNNFLTNEKHTFETSRICSNYVKENTGATEKILDLIYR